MNNSLKSECKQRLCFYLRRCYTSSLYLVCGSAHGALGVVQLDNFMVGVVLYVHDGHLLHKCSIIFAICLDLDYSCEYFIVHAKRVYSWHI